LGVTTITSCFFPYPREWITGLESGALILDITQSRFCKFDRLPSSHFW